MIKILSPDNSTVFMDEDFAWKMLEYANEHKGGTFDCFRNEIVEKPNGYFVSKQGLSEAFDELDFDDVLYYIHRHSLDIPGHGKLGIWFDEDNQEWVLDNSLWIPSRECAERIGRENHQKAIWDCAQAEAIELSD